MFLPLLPLVSPVSSITWYKDGSLLSPSNQPRVTLEQGSRVLSVSSVGEEDTGMYWCQAEQLGFDDTAVNSTTEELLVLGEPEDGGYCRGPCYGIHRTKSDVLATCKLTITLVP